MRDIYISEVRAKGRTVIWRGDMLDLIYHNMQHRGSSDSRATADSHCETQGSRNEVKCHGNASAEMSFNLGKSSCGEGLMSRWFGTRHSRCYMGNHLGLSSAICMSISFFRCCFLLECYLFRCRSLRLLLLL